MLRIGLPTTAITMIAAAIVWGRAGFLTVLFLAGAIFLLSWLRRAAHVVVPELHVGVVYQNDTRSFSRLLPAGRHWLTPFAEEIVTLVPTSGQSVKAICKSAQASGGIPLKVAWNLSYSVDPTRLDVDKLPKLARKLGTKSATIARKHVDNCIQHVVGDYTIAELTDAGVQRRLERQVRQLVRTRLESLGFKITRIMIGTIELPPHVMAALEAAQERALQTEQEAHALAQLHKVVSQFSEADMQRLMELERIHALGQNGVTLMMPGGMSAPAGGELDSVKRKWMDSQRMMVGLN